MARITRQINNSIFCLLIFTSVPSVSTNQFPNLLAENNLKWTVAGITTLAISAVVAYKAYQSYAWHDQFIKNSQYLYKIIHQDSQHYHSLYYYDAQLSDWELKDVIIKNSQAPYPFIAYHSTLTKAAWVLKKHLIELNSKLKKIERIVKNLHIESEKSECLKENFIRLYTKGTNLQKTITKVITMIAIIKKRIELFREYSHDCHNWSQSEANLRYCKANLRLSSRSNERNASIISSRSPSIT